MEIELPDEVQDEDIEFLVQGLKQAEIRVVCVEGKRVVSLPMQASKIALYRKGKMLARYKLCADDVWRRVAA